LTTLRDFAKLRVNTEEALSLTQEQVERLCQIVPKYGLYLEHRGSVITKVDKQTTDLDTAKYMPDQFVDLLSQMIATKMKADLWQWQ